MILNMVHSDDKMWTCIVDTEILDKECKKIPVPGVWGRNDGEGEVNQLLLCAIPGVCV